MLTLTSIVVYCNDLHLLIKDSLVQAFKKIKIKRQFGTTFTNARN